MDGQETVVPNIMVLLNQIPQKIGVHHILCLPEILFDTPKMYVKCFTHLEQIVG